MNVVLSGSFKKYLKEMFDLKQSLENDGITVLKPQLVSTIENPDNPDFIKFVGEEDKSEGELEREYLYAIENSDAHIICNFGGYLGEAAGNELSYGSGARIPVYLLEPIKDVSASDSCETKKLHLWYGALVQRGLVKIGLAEMYKDFNIETKKFK